MPRKDIEFKNSMGITLRGWFYTPEGASETEELPCIVMVHGFAAVKEMALDNMADIFTSKLKMTALVYDNRGYGASDVGVGQHKLDINPWEQIADFSDAVTYAQTLPQVDGTNIGAFGSSFSGGHVICVAAGDKRVKAVISQVPFIDGWAVLQRLIRADFLGGLLAGFEADRHARAAGQAPIMIPLVDPNPLAQSALPTPDGNLFYQEWFKKLPHLQNQVTLKSMETLRIYIPANLIEFVSPTPLLMTVADNDTLTPTDCSLKAFGRALEPKKLVLQKGGHFDAYSGKNFDEAMDHYVEFLKTTLLA